MNKIAVVGMACLFPGAHSPAEYWQNLLAGTDSTSPITADQMGLPPEWLYDPRKGTPDRMYYLRGGYIQAFQLDTSLYPPAVAGMDALHQWSLHVAREALLDSGYLDRAEVLARTGIILGNLSFPTRKSHQLVSQLYHREIERALRDLLHAPDFELATIPTDQNVAPENIAISGYPAGLAAQVFGLGALNLCLDAACASSLYAVKFACDVLNAQQADMMLAGAVSASDPYNISMGFSIFQAYPESGQASRPLDKSSKGLTAAEGAGVFVLKRYDDAVRDGDQIYATILGVGLSNDGAGKHLLSPSSTGQIRAFERAYAQAGIDPQTIDYLECHATGTPLGDATEMQSIQQFFAPDIPLMGSAKSNFGHLLTAAGMAGMIKVIYSLAHQQLPPTLHVADPLLPQVVTKLTAWQGQRAAIDAFGFGGTNAHLILEASPHTATQTPPPAPSPTIGRGNNIPLHEGEGRQGEGDIQPTPLAIVGMDAFFGELDGLAEFQAALYQNEPVFSELPLERWKGLEQDAPVGAYLESFDLDFLYFKTPPTERDQVIPQQLLMLKVADRAIKDAGLAEGSNVAVLIGMGTELALHLFRERVDLSWQIRVSLAQAGLQISEGELATLENLVKESVHEFPQVNQYVSFIGNIIANRISARWNFSGASFTVSAEENSVFKALELAHLLLATGEVEAVVVGGVDLAGGLENILIRQPAEPVGEGAGAVVLKRLDQADSDRVYAVIESVGMAQHDPAQAAEIALARANRKPEEIGYVEDANPTHIENPTPDPLPIHREGEKPLPVAGSVRAVIGQTFNAAGIASLIRTALCIYHRYLPEPRPWLADQRVAAIRSRGMDGTAVQVIVGEAPQRTIMPHIQAMPYYLFPLSGDSLEALLVRLEDLRSRLSAVGAHSYAPLPIIATQTYLEFDPAAAYRVAVVGGSESVLRREIALLQQALPQGVDFETPQGSCFTANPVQGEIAFVYPGAFNAYVGMGRDLLYLFPDLYDQISQITSDVGRSLAADKIFPPGYLTDNQKRLNNALREDQVAMIEGGASLALLYTLILRDQFGVKPDAAFGYSMGESSMLWSMGIWRDGDLASRLLRESPLFTERLVGKKLAAQEYAGIGGEQWATYTLNAPAEAVYAQVAGSERVFITLINTPQEVVISGDQVACQQVIAALGCEAMLSPISSVIHCPAMHSEYPLLMTLHHLPAHPVTDVRCYSASTYAPIETDTTSVTEHISQATCAQIDFPRLVQQVYHDGARIFIELGARSTCTRWIGEILQGQEHLAVSMDRPRGENHVALIRLLAKLVIHHVPLDLSPLYMPLPQPAGKTLIKQVKTGGKRIYETLVTPENRQRFGNLTRMEKPIQPSSPLLPHGEGGNSSMTKETPSFDASSVNGRGAGGGWSLSHSEITSQHEEIATPALLTGAHVTYLQAQQQHIRQYGDLMRLKMNTLQGQTGVGAEGRSRPAPADGLSRTVGAHSYAPLHETPVQASPLPKPITISREVIWDEADLLEFAEGSIANVFGAEYASIDQYHRRVRLPMPPYLLVSRVTQLDATIHEYKPSSLTTEYDIPADGWYLVDGQIPWAVAVESGQCDLLLISYLGIDFENKGEYVYRLLDCTLTFLDDLPKAGDTLRYDIKINSFAQSGNNLLFFFSYECFVGEKMVLKMTNGCAGFFSDEQLAEGKGVIYSADEIAARSRVQPQTFMPRLLTDRTEFERDDLLALTQGDLAACFGEGYQARGFNPSLRLPPAEILMLDRITRVERTGGAWGLGLIEAEKDLSPDDWYFPCHFKDDQVMAGSLMAEGCGQLLQFYLLYLGMQTRTLDARFQPINGLPQVVRCRGQVTPTTGKLVYRMEVTGLGLDPAPYAKANVEIILNGKVVVHFRDLALQLVEKNPLPAALFNERQIEEFALGSIPACFGEDYEIYFTRQTPRTPNGDLKLINRIVEVNAARLDFKPGSNLLAEYDVPLDAWYYAETGTMPYSVLMEIGLQPCGFLSAYLGSTLLFPEERLYFRNLDGDGTLSELPDLRGKTIRNRVSLLSSTALEGFIIQNFTYELAVEGQPFYRGFASFGYFSAPALANQVGLDQVQEVRPAYESQPDLALQQVDLRGQPGQLNLLDEVWVGEKYLFASKIINSQDWFYTCHFHQDPVMPGSLGVEAILQAMQVYAATHGFMQNRRAEALPDHKVVWKYRGQITPENQQMYLEVHVTHVEQRGAEIVIMGEASLWKDNMRIYELKQIGLRLVE